MQDINKLNINLNKNENKIYLFSKIYLNNIKIQIYDYNPYTEVEVLLYEHYMYEMMPDINYWFSPNTYMTNSYGIKVKIYSDDNIKEEFFKLKTKHGIDIKTQVLVIHAYGGLGDNIICTSIIRKLYKLYKQKILVYSYYPEIFINNPYISNVVKIEKEQDSYSLSFDNNIYEVHNIWHSFCLPYNIINKSTLSKSSNSGWLASQIGLSLEDDELLLDFFPDNFDLDIKLPEKYLVINPNITAPAKTWGEKNWKKFIELIQEKIYVVALGKQSELILEKKYINDIEIKNGINLINKTNLSQAWHIINNSQGVVTHNSGLYCLSLTTKTKIFELGSHTKPFYYKGINNNDINIILGECKKFCIEDMNFYINEHGTINSLIDGTACSLYDNFKCHPTPEQVLEEVINKLNL